MDDSFVVLTIVSFSDEFFVDKNHIAPRLSLVNVSALNKLLRSEVFVSEDRQLRVAPLILDYEPLSRIFQDAGQAIKAGDPRLNRIDVSKLGFLARKDLPLVQLPIQRVPQEVAASREGTDSAHLSLSAEIDQFRLEDEGEASGRPIILSESEANIDRLSTANTPSLVVAQINFESEEEEMILNQRRSLRDLMASRNKGVTSQEVPKSQVPTTLPPPLTPLPTDPSLHAIRDLKKKRPLQEIEEEELLPQKGTK